MYRVIVIDDSDFYRRFLEQVINSFEDFEVVATAEDAYDAREKIKQFKPDLVTIDINMPKMDGIVFLKNLMRLHPMPSFIVSSEAARHKEAYEDGALGFVEKTRADENPQEFIHRLKTMLLNFTYLYDRYRQKNRPSGPAAEDGGQKLSPDVMLLSKPALGNSMHAVAIAASTGGIEAIHTLVSALPEHTPPIFIVQHIPHGFARSFIQRLRSLTKLNVVEVTESVAIEADTLYLSGGTGHLLVSPSGKPSHPGFVTMAEGPRISRHLPSADILFRSVNNTFGKQTLGVILTGMGDDGVIGLKELYVNGAWTLAQDEASCVVFGMPRKAIEVGAISEILSLQEISRKIANFCVKHAKISPLMKI
ncbi:MAG: chemotaxis-specific protein-glutamate methyltransferase CheB [Sulfuricurvum sp.]